MMTKSPITINEEYYEALGYVKANLTHVDFYRFQRVKQQLLGTSVLDIGCGKADFLKLIKNEYQIAGTEVNQERVRHCNKVLRQDVVKLGNLNQKLDFESNSFDTVTCMEVLEHLDDPKSALEELTRISRKRIVITVPFNENIRYVLCLHCARYTPLSGHLHSLNKNNIARIIPGGIKIIKTELLCNGALRHIPVLSNVFRLPVKISSSIDNMCAMFTRRAGWMMVVLDKS